MKKNEIDPKLPTELKAKLEFSKAADLFRIAEDHKTIYLTIQSAAALELRPIVEWYVENGDLKSAERFVYENYPDCVERVLILRYIDAKSEG